MKKLKKLFISVLLLSFGVIFMNEVMAYTHEVRQSGNSYVWRVNNVDQGTTSNLAVAIMNTMGTNREIHILVSGTITQTINVSASGVKLRFHGNTLTCNFTGSGIINNGHNGFEISDLTLRNVVGGYGIRSSAASDLRFVNVRAINIDWIGIRIDSRNSNPWNYTIYNLYMRDIHVENCGSHGLETYGIDGMTIEGTVTARNTGGSGVLFNQTRNGTVATVDAYNCNWGGGYAGLRYANGCNNLTTNKLIADRCGRGFFIVQSGPSVNCHLNNAEIYETSNIGIWIENGTNCSVKAGCSQSGVSVSGSGSYANVSSTCGGSSPPPPPPPSGNYVRLANRGTGLFLDGMGRTSNGSNAGQWASSNHNNQQWQQLSVGSGYYQFRNRGTNLYLDGMGRTSNGAECGQWANTNHNNSHWSISSISSAEMEEASIIEFIQKKVAIYPNPVTNGRLNVELTGLDGTSSLRIFDMNGKIIQEQQVRDEQFVEMYINVRSGLYMLQVINKDEVITRKFSVN